MGIWGENEGNEENRMGIWNQCEYSRNLGGNVEDVQNQGDDAENQGET